MLHRARPRVSALLGLILAGGLAAGLTACGQQSTDAETADTPNATAGNEASGQSSRGKAPKTVDAQAIRDHVVGNTVSGKMSSGDAYGEYYAPDGRILAKTYTGHWQITDDRLCLDYGQGTTCYGVALDGLQVVWYANGKRVGQGTLRAGNPNDFTDHTAD